MYVYSDKITKVRLYLTPKVVSQTYLQLFKKF